MEKSMTDHIDAKSERISAFRSYVQQLRPFHNNGRTGQGPSGATLWGEWVTRNPWGPDQALAAPIYVVFSYRRTWPLFINWRGIWFRNEDKFSRTTSKHSSQAHPLTAYVPLTTNQMQFLVGAHHPTGLALTEAVKLKLIGENNPDVLVYVASQRLTA
jgi:hypothetical protein